VYAILYTLSVLLFFGLPKVFPGLNIPAVVAQKQAAFLALGPARTSLPLEVLEPSFSSYMQQLPAALQHVFLRPWITDYRLSLLLIPHILEWAAYFLLLVLWCLYRKKEPAAGVPYVWMTIFLVVTVWLFIGYTIPVLGAIIRYRALYLPLLLTPVLAQTDWESLGKKLNILK
jgi:hypothetical protein